MYFAVSSGDIKSSMGVLMLGATRMLSVQPNKHPGTGMLCDLQAIAGDLQNVILWRETIASHLVVTFFRQYLWR